jgi:hypothetical protein
MSMDFLEALEEQLVAATERGIGRRRWRWPWLKRLRLPWRASTVGIAAGLATALAASALAATLTLPASHPKALVAARAAQPRSYTTAGTVPAGFEPESFTATGELTWWLLGEAPCGAHMCTSIVRTRDGGRTFTRIPAPAAGNLYELRFADAADGYAYGGLQLWSTHDGGHSWTLLRVGGAVDALAVADGYAYAVVSTSTLIRSPVGRDRWTAVRGLGRGMLSGLWVQGSAVIIQAGNRLLVSNDKGAHFTRVRGVVHAGDCGYDAAIDPSVIWALCTTGMAPDDVLRSADSGKSFSSVAQVPDGPIDAFAAASTTAAVASGQGPLFRTTDAGTSWSPVVAPSAAWTYLGFTDATHGVALGNFGSGRRQQSRLYYTTDGGASYHFVPIG